MLIPIKFRKHIAVFTESLNFYAAHKTLPPSLTYLRGTKKKERNFLSYYLQNLFHPFTITILNTYTE